MKSSLVLSIVRMETDGNANKEIITLKESLIEFIQ